MKRYRVSYIFETILSFYSFERIVKAHLHFSSKVTLQLQVVAALIALEESIEIFVP